MAVRSYMSIGEVLNLLKDEFPDVTISKIRFLESQGLLDPERTPSGYRKFYDTDVERLRWILRQQREHFLPLKVIKGRLAGTVPEPDGASAPEEESARPRDAAVRRPRVEANDDLADAPQRINEDAYGEGWIAVIEPSAATELDQLMDAAAYRSLVEG